MDGNIATFDSRCLILAAAVEAVVLLMEYFFYVFSVDLNQVMILKGALYDIHSINIAANNHLLCKDIEE